MPILPNQRAIVSIGCHLVTQFLHLRNYAYLIIGALLITCPIRAFSQSTGSQGSQPPAGAQLPKITPPSPTVAALMKYVETPVGTYTGIPSVNIPLYEIKVRDITVPITLSYHAGGNRVDEEASWVGLGWSLNAGGAIGCTIRGKEDVTYSQMSPYPMPVLGYNQYTEECKPTVGGKQYDYHGAYGTSEWDLDNYSYNFLSYTGQYVLQQRFANGKLELVPQLLNQQKMRVEYPNPYIPGSSRRMTASDGTVYEFGEQEQTTVIGTGKFNTSAIYLSKITSPQGEVVTFAYDYNSPTNPASPPIVYPVSSYTDIRTVKAQHCNDLGVIQNYALGGNLA